MRGKISAALLMFFHFAYSVTPEYTSLTEALKNPSAVKSLNLSGKGLTYLSENISLLTNLERLNLSQNNLTSLPKGLFKLKKLKTLNLTQNKLTSLPASIGNLKNLVTLEIGFNQISSLPKELNSLTKLNRLVVMKNNLKSLPAELSLQALEIIDFSYNQFISVPVSLCAFLKLRTVDFSFNKNLEAFPQEIKRLAALRLLNLKNTKISSKQIEDLMWLIPDCQIVL